MRRSVPSAWLLLVLLALVALPFPGFAGDDKDNEKKDEWDVDNPPGEWVSISIETTETTWSNVDISPDGRTLVFDMLGDLYTVPVRGGDATSLTGGISWDFQPRYSPDGGTIAFVSDRGGANNIWIVNADGTDPRPVSKEKEHLVHNPSWSPDGEYIVARKDFTSTRSIAAGEIWLFYAGGGRGMQLTERPFGKRDQKTMAEPAFSPDGRYVYYSQDVTDGRVWQYNKDSTGEIFAIKRLDRETGRDEVFVSGPGGAIRPVPSPDGRTLAFVKRLPGLASALYLKDLETGKEWPVYDAMERDLQETFGSQGISPAFAWTPDSREIIFWARGKIRRLDIRRKQAEVIPVSIRTQRKIQPALRFPVDVAPARFKVRMPRWARMSPSGSRVVFQALGYLYVKDLENSGQQRLTSQRDHFEMDPSWSPDRRSIVYTTWNDDELGSVRVIPATGGSGRTLTGQPGHFVEPRFSPDGTKVVYRKITGGYLLSGNWSLDPGLYVTEVSGGEPIRISDSGFNPQFSPDGSRVFFSEQVEETELAFKSVNLQGDDERIHLVGSKVTEFDISPGGNWIAFTEQYNAYVAPFTATGRKVAIASDMKSIPVRQVSSRAGEWLHWSHDGRMLHWSHGPYLYTRDLRDAFTFLEGAPEELPEPVEKGISLSFTADADVPEGRIALTGARVITMRDARGGLEEVLEEGVVLVKGNRIEAVGKPGEVVIPPDARRFDMKGRTILPGLIDVHAHGSMETSEIIPQQNWLQFANLAFGVTTIHDPSNDTTGIFAAAELQRAGRILAPRIFSTGTILYGAHVPGLTAGINSLEDARFHVRRLKDAGAISVKSYQQPRREQRQQIIAAGRELEMMVVPEGGGKFQNNMNMIVDGHTGIEHSLSLATCYDDVRQFWSATEVGYTPTMVVSFGGLSGEYWFYQHDEVWKNERLMTWTPRFIVEPRAMRRLRSPEDHYNHILVAEFAKELIDSGVSVQIGAHGQLAGLAAHWEFWMFEQGGFTPWEALRSAMFDGARYVGLDGDLGSIEKGKLADLIVIDGNPLEDLRLSERVAYTMLNGRLYDTSDLSQIAPNRVERKVFFFKKEGGDTIHPETESRIRALETGHHRVH